MKLSLFPILGLAMVACAVPAEEDVSSSSESGLAVPPKVEAAVRANLLRLEKEIGVSHLSAYRGYGSVVGQFMWALDVEYGESPTLLRRRADVLAAPVYFSMPEILPEQGVGRRTAFHGMTETDFSKLGSNEDTVFGWHKAWNGGSKDGIRPFSVCETKFLIGISKGEISGAFAPGGYVSSFDSYAPAYAAWAKPEANNCTQRDLDDFFNYRGLGELRPSWLESNYEDRVLRRYATMCKNPPQDWWGRCGEYGAGRLRVREKKNRAMALRQMVYDPRPESKIGTLTDEQYMTSPYNTVLLLEDRLGDGVSELVTPGALDLLANARFELTHSTLGNKWITVSYDKKTYQVDNGPALAVTSATLAIESTGSFTGELRGSFAFADGSSATAKLPPRVLKALVRTDPAWKKEYADAPDMGLLRLFPNDKAALMKRFTSMLDRHEHFYKTYSSNDENDLTIGSQPSPLVACSVTVNASRAWAYAGTPPGGRAGLIFLMRVPFKDILTSDPRSIDTLGRLSADPQHGGPKVLTLDKVYEQGSLDMTRVWLDLATLSNDLYSSENEVSKFGAVAAEQIEGILVLGKPGAVP
jgi:hypothetical protein